MEFILPSIKWQFSLVYFDKYYHIFENFEKNYLIHMTCSNCSKRSRRSNKSEKCAFSKTKSITPNMKYAQIDLKSQMMKLLMYKTSTCQRLKQTCSRSLVCVMPYGSFSYISRIITWIWAELLKLQLEELKELNEKTLTAPQSL